MKKKVGAEVGKPRGLAFTHFVDVLLCERLKVGVTRAWTQYVEPRKKARNIGKILRTSQ